MPSGQTAITHRLAEPCWLFLSGKAIYLSRTNSLSSFPTSCLHERAEYTAQAGLPNKQLQRNSTEKQLMSAHSEIRNQARTDRTAGNSPSPWPGTGTALLGEDADNKAKLRTTWSSCVFQRVLLSHAQYCDILKYLASGVHHKYLETLNDNSGELVHVANTLDVVVH